MTKVTERQLMRLVHGELPADEALRLEREIERDGELRAARDRLAETWASLELPASELPGGFSASVTVAARELCDGGLSWSLAPAWARGGAAAALVTGLLLGAVFGRGFELPDAGSAGSAGSQTVVVADADADAIPLTLAEVYWLSLEESGGALATDDAAEGVP